MTDPHLLEPTTRVYVLRHAQPLHGREPNRLRPLTDVGHAQARALVPYLRSLVIDRVYASPYRRALDTVRPFCESAGADLNEIDDLRESSDDEPFEEVRQRTLRAVAGLVAANVGRTLLVCTHGGLLWTLINTHDPDFGYEEYRRLGCPDMRRFLYEDGQGRMDASYRFDLELP